MGEPAGHAHVANGSAARSQQGTKWSRRRISMNMPERAHSPVTFRHLATIIYDGVTEPDEGKQLAGTNLATKRPPRGQTHPVRTTSVSINSARAN